MKFFKTAFLLCFLFFSVNRKSYSMIIASSIPSSTTTEVIQLVGGLTATAGFLTFSGYTIHGLIHHGATQGAVSSILMGTYIGGSILLAGIVLDEDDEISVMNEKGMKLYMQENFYTDEEINITLSDMQSLNPRLKKGISLPLNKIPGHNHQKIQSLQKIIKEKTDHLIAKITAQVFLETQTTVLD